MQNYDILVATCHAAKCDVRAQIQSNYGICWHQCGDAIFMIQLVHNFIIFKPTNLREFFFFFNLRDAALRLKLKPRAANWLRCIFRYLAYSCRTFIQWKHIWCCIAKRCDAVRHELKCTFCYAPPSPPLSLSADKNNIARDMVRKHSNKHETRQFNVDIYSHKIRMICMWTPGMWVCVCTNAHTPNIGNE